MQTWHDFLEKNSALVIEGNPPAVKRKKILDAIENAEPGQWLMLANANRPEYAAERAKLIEKASKVETFDANENGSKFRIIEFYRMPGGSRRKAKKDETREESEQEEWRGSI